MTSRAVETPSPRARMRPRAKTRPTARAAILVVVVTALALTMVVPFREYLSGRQQVGSLQRQEQTLKQANARLKGQLKRLHDPSYLEQLARECLGMVKPGEIGFVTVPDEGSPPLVHC